MFIELFYLLSLIKEGSNVIVHSCSEQLHQCPCVSDHSESISDVSSVCSVTDQHSLTQCVSSLTVSRQTFFSPSDT